MMQVDVNRSQEFRKCIECYLCQNVCHVIRDHPENERPFAGPRFLMRVTELEMHPADEADRREIAQDDFGLGYCNITKCCTEVCPEHIKITDNALIPMKERVVGRKYDPLVWLGSKISRRPAPKDTPRSRTRSRSSHRSPRPGTGRTLAAGLALPAGPARFTSGAAYLAGSPGQARVGRRDGPGRAGVPPRGGCLLVRRGRLDRAGPAALQQNHALLPGTDGAAPSPPYGRGARAVAGTLLLPSPGGHPACGRRPPGLVRLHFWLVRAEPASCGSERLPWSPPDISRGSDRRPVPGGDRAVPGVQPGAQRADPGAGGGSWAQDLSVTRPGSPYLAFIVGLHVATAIAMIIYSGGTGCGSSSASSPRSRTGGSRPWTRSSPG